ncbi:hypothetical protein RM704_36320 [Streptomyces sp. DSM 3412]|uniref:Uncharacterized protein n=1 Tax=Streptomyces gottesmaniae TaxID=3075518 RepID=A0ABU2Z912_9ACTN|nr:hypothetical protein [Streptomyces sp. DSM 3412]MDT0572866.1 hypothetical protein [Streptomyces sp. DSM 3412]
MDGGPIVSGRVASAHQLGAAASALLGATARDLFGAYDVVWTTLSAVCGVGPGRPWPYGGRGESGG